jgi:serine 3-dehydrogenase
VRPAVVTGASSGIGRAAAIALSSAGCAVVLTGRDAGKLEQAVAECSSSSTFLAGDLRTPGFLAELLKAAKFQSGEGLPILVNSAGLVAVGHTHEQSAEEIRDQIELNLTVPLLVCREFIPWMLERSGGDIVNVSSISATTFFPTLAAYCGSKAGLVAATRSMANDYRKEGIRFLSLIPGSTDTSLWDEMGFIPDRSDMIPAKAVGEVIRDAVLTPRDRSFDEIVLMPPKGIL